MQNDIEIYIKKRATGPILDWLTGTFGHTPDIVSTPSKGATKLRITTERGVLPVMLVQQGQWTSVWFNSAHTPWASDLACAQSAAEVMQTTVRCSDGGWQEGDDPDQFLEVTDGTVGTVIWRDE